MFEWLEIRDFRGVDLLRIEGLRRVNVFVGANGSGKSTVLEALAALCAGANAEMPLILNARRGIPYVTEAPSLATLFRDPVPGRDTPPEFRIDAGPLEEAAMITLRVRGRQRSGPSLDDRGGAIAGVTKLVGLEVECAIPDRHQRWSHVWQEGEADDSGPVPRSHSYYPMGRPTDPRNLAELVAAASERRFRQRVVKLLAAYVPGLTDLEVRPVGQGIAVFAVFEVGPARPIESLGGGALGMATCLLMCAFCAGGCLLVDELDTGLHRSVMADFLATLHSATADFSTQLLATTHSEEFLSYMADAFAAEPQALMVFRLERDEAGHRVVPIEHGALRTLMNVGLELR